MIKVGAATEVEMKERKHRIEDAVSATKAAVEEGIVPGGGVALLRARDALKTLKLDKEEEIGSLIVGEACAEPLRAIAENAGKKGDVVVGKVLELKGTDGYNAQTDTYEDMLKAGIVDPAKVTRFALQNAASISAMFLTTECVITDLPKKEEPAGGHGMGGGMGMDY